MLRAFHEQNRAADDGAKPFQLKHFPRASRIWGGDSQKKSENSLQLVAGVSILPAVIGPEISGKRQPQA
jgi:hypothetical protein